MCAVITTTNPLLSAFQPPRCFDDGDGAESGVDGVGDDGGDGGVDGGGDVCVDAGRDEGGDGGGDVCVDAGRDDGGGGRLSRLRRRRRRGKRSMLPIVTSLFSISACTIGACIIGDVDGVDALLRNQTANATTATTTIDRIIILIF